MFAEHLPCAFPDRKGRFPGTTMSKNSPMYRGSANICSRFQSSFLHMIQSYIRVDTLWGNPFFSNTSVSVPSQAKCRLLRAATMARLPWRLSRRGTRVLAQRFAWWTVVTVPSQQFEASRGGVECRPAATGRRLRGGWGVFQRLADGRCFAHGARL